MTLKKQTEVEVFAKFVSELCIQYKIGIVVDVGSGMVYLPPTLSQVKYPVRVINGHISFQIC